MIISGLETNKMHFKTHCFVYKQSKMGVLITLQRGFVIFKGFFHNDITYQHPLFERESSVHEEFALHADFGNLGSGFLDTDYMSFLQSPGTQSQNMRSNRLSHVYSKSSMNTVLFVNAAISFITSAKQA